MQIDNDALRKIMTMNDGELMKLISSVAEEKGLSLPRISSAELNRIRAVLGSMSPSDVEALERKLRENGGH